MLLLVTKIRHTFVAINIKFIFKRMKKNYPEYNAGVTGSISNSELETLEYLLEANKEALLNLRTGEKLLNVENIFLLVLT
jgi:hypothetical protein